MKSGESGSILRMTAEKSKGLKTPMIGRHQPENAGVAIQLYYLFCELNAVIFSEKSSPPMAKTYWPARMEKISNEPLIIIDGAHNTHAMEHLVETVEAEEFTNYRIHIIFVFCRSSGDKKMSMRCCNSC